MRPSGWAAVEGKLWLWPACRGPPAAVAAAAAGLALQDVALATSPVPTDHPQEPPWVLLGEAAPGRRCIHPACGLYSVDCLACLPADMKELT